MATTITKSQLRQMIKEAVLKEQSSEDDFSLDDFELPAPDPSTVARAVVKACRNPLKDYVHDSNKRMDLLMKIRKLIIQELGQG